MALPWATTPEQRGRASVSDDRRKPKHFSFRRENVTRRGPVSNILGLTVLLPTSSALSSWPRTRSRSARLWRRRSRHCRCGPPRYHSRPRLSRRSPSPPRTGAPTVAELSTLMLGNSNHRASCSAASTLWFACTATLVSSLIHKGVCRARQAPLRTCPPPPGCFGVAFFHDWFKS